MKIEKINDKQIRCTLTQADLKERNVALSELVYGGERAKNLFRDMLIQASREFGFDFKNNPLMIEAVPTLSGQLVLIITRVDDPEELDARFARFSPDETQNDDNAYPALTDSLTGADDILNILRHISTAGDKNTSAEAQDKNNARPSANGSASESGASGHQGRSGTSVRGQVRKTGSHAQGQAPINKLKGSVSGNAAENNSSVNQKLLSEEEIYQYTKFYLFHDLETVLEVACRVGSLCQGQNSLYKNPDDGSYYLLVSKMDTEAEQFNRICNVLSEYAMPMDYAKGMDEFFREHMQIIVASQALQMLREI